MKFLTGGRGRSIWLTDWLILYEGALPRGKERGDKRQTLQISPHICNKANPKDLFWVNRIDTKVKLKARKTSGTICTIYTWYPAENIDAMPSTRTVSIRRDAIQGAKRCVGWYRNQQRECQVSWPNSTHSAGRDKAPDIDLWRASVIIGSLIYTAITLRLCYLQISTPVFIPTGSPALRGILQCGSRGVHLSVQWGLGNGPYLWLLTLPR